MMEKIHAEKGPFLRQLTPDDRFIGFYLLRRMQLEPFRDASRGYFLTLFLGDRSGQMMGRVWENAEDTYQKLSEGEVVKVDGEVETYLERTQIRVLRVRPAAAGEYDIRDMLPASQRDPGEMMAELQFFIDNIQDQHLAALVNAFYSDPAFSQMFAQAPASRRVHHAYLHGLLEHTVELLTLSQTLLEIYPEVHPDLLTTGILLHDIGKVREFTWELDIDYTDEGRLVGHIVMGDEMLTDALAALPDFPPDLALNLRHMLLAHHGKYEWGSPRRPKTLEAIALHHLENLSAQVNRFKLLLENRPSGQSWTEYDRLLGRQLYAGEDGSLTIEERSWEE